MWWYALGLALTLRERPRVVVAVNSAQGNKALRDLARASWLSSLAASAQRAGLSARAVFALTRPAEEPGVLALDAQEGYQELPQKTAALLRWFAAQRDDVLVEVDDDVFVHTDRLMAVVADLWRANETLYAGYTQAMPTEENADPASKWFVPDEARAAVPNGIYVTGQLKVLSRLAARQAVAAMDAVGLAPWGLGPKDRWMPVEDEYVGVLMQHARVAAQSIQRAVAPQCCAKEDPVLVLDGDTFFVKTWNHARAWTDEPVADAHCRYARAAARFRAQPGASFCLSEEDLALQTCPPSVPSPTPLSTTDAMLRTIC